MDKDQYSILMHIYGNLKDGNDNPICKTDIASFFRVCWWLSAWYELGLQWRDLRQSWELNPIPPPHSITCPIGGGVWSEVAGAEALRFMHELLLLIFSVYFSLSLNQDSCPGVGGRGRVLMQWGPYSDNGLMCSLCWAPFRCSPECNYPSPLRADHFPQVPQPPLCYGISAGQEGPMWTISIILSTSCDGVTVAETLAASEMLLE